MLMIHIYRHTLPFHKVDSGHYCGSQILQLWLTQIAKKSKKRDGATVWGTLSRVAVTQNLLLLLPLPPLEFNDWNECGTK